MTHRVIKNKGSMKRHFVKDAVRLDGREIAYTTLCNREFPTWWIEFVDEAGADCKLCLKKGNVSK